MSELIKVGDKAPEFVLKDQDGKDIKSTDFNGKRMLLSFHPLAWTPICRDQMNTLEEKYDAFEKLGVVPLGISIDTVYSKKAWADFINIKKTRLLCDFWPHGELARKLGIFRENNGFSERANLIVDGEGNIKFVKVYEIKTIPDIEEILEFLRK